VEYDRSAPGKWRQLQAALNQAAKPIPASTTTLLIAYCACGSPL
jgi:hypothetical protein